MPCGSSERIKQSAEASPGLVATLIHATPYCVLGGRERAGDSSVSQWSERSNKRVRGTDDFSWPIRWEIAPSLLLFV